MKWADTREPGVGLWTNSSIFVICRACRDAEDVAETSPQTPKASQSEKSPTQLYRRVQIGSAKTQFQFEFHLGRHGSQVRCARYARRGNATPAGNAPG